MHCRALIISKYTLVHTLISGSIHMLGGRGDSITTTILSESKPTAGRGRGRRNKSIFVILTKRDNNGKHPKPNLLSPTLQGLARPLSTVATAYINLKKNFL